MKTFMKSLRVSNSIGNIKVKIRFAHCKHLKSEQKYLQSRADTFRVFLLHMFYFLSLEYLCSQFNSYVEK